MNPTIILTVAVLWGSTVAGSYFYGRSDGRDLEKGTQAAATLAAAETRKIAMEGAADAIAKIEVRHQVVRGKVETIVRENVVYRDCKHDDAGLRLINEALTGRAQPPGDSAVP